MTSENINIARPHFFYDVKKSSMDELIEYKPKKGYIMWTISVSLL